MCGILSNFDLEAADHDYSLQMAYKPILYLFQIVNHVFLYIGQYYMSLGNI